MRERKARERAPDPLGAEKKFIKYNAYADSVRAVVARLSDVLRGRVRPTAAWHGSGRARGDIRRESLTANSLAAVWAASQRLGSLRFPCGTGVVARVPCAHGRSSRRSPHAALGEINA